MEELSDATGVMEVDRTYSYGLDLIAQDRFDIGSSAWDATFYLYDGHGNVRALADDAGTITDTYDYDAFGTLIEQLVLDASASGLVPVTTDNRDLTTDNQYLYCGEQFDPDLGLYFLRARYMDTDRGRFWSMDSFEGWTMRPGSLHKYLYAEGNPVSFVDPNGEVSIVGLLIASAIIAIVAPNIVYDNLAYPYEQGATQSLLRSRTEREIEKYAMRGGFRLREFLLWEGSTYTVRTLDTPFYLFAPSSWRRGSSGPVKIHWAITSLSPPAVSVAYVLGGKLISFEYPSAVVQTPLR